MKHLICALAAVSAGALFADVQSANVVGYAGVATEEYSAPIVGAQFLTVGDTTGEFDLSMLSVPGTYVDDEYDYMEPRSEWIRVLDTDSSATLAEYTYISREYIIDNVDDEDPDEYAWAIGWWKHDSSARYDKLIGNEDDTLKVKTAVKFPNGTAFLGKFSSGHSLRLVSNGEVVVCSTAFLTDEASAPLFVNFLPVDIDLADITVPGTCVDDEYDYMEPRSEWIRDLDWDSSATLHEYTYISREYIIDNVDDEDPDEYAWAIGWWQHDSSARYDKLIENEDDTLKIKTAVPVKAGTGFLGVFSSGHSLSITFPSAMDVPSKK